MKGNALYMCSPVVDNMEDQERCDVQQEGAVFTDGDHLQLQDLDAD